MGQYHFIVNLDKKEYLNAHNVRTGGWGCGLKAWEQLASAPSPMHCMFAAMVCPEKRGGGDIDEHEWVGRWHGDHVVLCGDYWEAEDHDRASEAGQTWEEGSPGFVDVSYLASQWLEDDGKAQILG